MGELDNKTKYNIKYAKEKLKRIPLDVQQENYAEIKREADRVGESVNGYIKKAIRERMERERQGGPGFHISDTNDL
jgi:predicted HicB family RNase H-like nuclease